MARSSPITAAAAIPIISPIFAAWLFGRLEVEPADAAALAAAANAVELRSAETPRETVDRTLTLLRQLDLLERIG